MKCLRKKRTPKKQKFNIRYIVVHTTGTRPGVVMRELDKLPYHYLITQGGRLINIKPLQLTDGTIEVAMSGGLDKHGNHVDKRSERQNETLFNTLVMLTEAYPDATIKSADELYLYGFPNPGFHVRGWIHNYIPLFLQAA